MSDGPASDALRSALIFLPDDGRLVRFDGGFAMLTPSNPGYWWGNALHFDRAPTDADFEHWPALFRTHVHAVQPASTHVTLAWDDDRPGDVGRFVEAGYAYFSTLGLAVDRGDPVVAPHPGADAIVALTDGDWPSLLRLMVETRVEDQSEAAYTEFATRRIDGWRALHRAGRGSWFGVRSPDRPSGLLAALGVFAERDRGPDGRRIGRFQHVVTDPSARRRGLAGRLVEHGSHDAFDRLDVDTLLIMADEHDDARRVYEACGFRMRSRHHGLELPG